MQRIYFAAILLTMPFVLGLSIALYFPVAAYMASTYAEEPWGSDIRLLVALCAINSVIAATAAVTLAVVEGCGRLDYKNRAIIASNVLGIVAAILLIQQYGAIGLGATYCALSGFQLVAALIGMFASGFRAADPGSGSVMNDVRELRSSSAKLASISILRLSFEPVTKALLSVTAGLGAVAAYDLAYRVSTQMRIVIQAALQPLLVLGARRGESKTVSVNATFGVANEMARRYSIELLAVQIAASAAISFVGFGGIDADFVLFFILLCFANCINAVGLVGYFYELSSGRLDYLVSVHFVMAITNIAFGVVAAVLDFESGVVLAYCLAFSYGGLACAGLLPDGSSWKERCVGLSTAFARARRALILASVVLAVGFFDPANGQFNLGLTVSVVGAALLLARFGALLRKDFMTSSAGRVRIN